MKQQQNNTGEAIGFPVKNWQKCSRPPQTDMIGRYCRLSPLDIDKHAKPLYQAYAQDSDAQNWTYLSYGPFSDIKSFRIWLQNSCTGQDPFFYVVIDNSNGSIIGLASYLRIVPAVGVIEVGHIHFSPLLQGTVMSTEAMFLMMQRVFDELGYRRYEWKCDSLNEKSNKAAKRLGFTFEGIFRQATLYKGRNRDTAWYSILDSEWPKLKQAFILWLDSDNFDSYGVQRKSLGNILT
ncbi:MAG: GNAT family N-acetyltransferase [Alcanivoracaceae bacterium]|nr:GNAT family N-acetyltransferase [Alcanivoracaceae bacterium]